MPDIAIPKMLSATTANIQSPPVAAIYAVAPPQIARNSPIPSISMRDKPNLADIVRAPRACNHHDARTAGDATEGKRPLRPCKVLNGATGGLQNFRAAAQDARGFERFSASTCAEMGASLRRCNVLKDPWPSSRMNYLPLNAFAGP